MKGDIDIEELVTPFVQDVVVTRAMAKPLGAQVAKLTKDFAELYRLIAASKLSTKEFGALVTIAAKAALEIVVAEKEGEPLRPTLRIVN
jgi:hypothetical protein